jgi:N-acetylmuramoyl-L-alanine amidase
MLKYFSIAAMLAVLIVFSTLGLAEIRNKDHDEPLLINAKFHNLTSEAQRQVLCLANNIYFEARSEPLKGQVAVAFVTLNRVDSELFPDNVCDVVKQKTKTVCQFSWYCESQPKSKYVQHILTGQGSMLYYRIVDIATFVYVNYEKLDDPSNGSLFYHANYVSPNWRHRLDQVAVIGNHIFYRTRGNT